MLGLMTMAPSSCEELASRDIPDPPWLSGEPASNAPPRLQTYHRRKRKTCDESTQIRNESETGFSSESFKVKKANTKRIGGQYFLDFGQSDFSYSTCRVCGLLYAPGEDKKIHDVYHKKHLQGVQFKGWRNERVVTVLAETESRIILITSDDPSQHQLKVKEVASLMENEMGLAPEWLIHKKCQVYLYIRSGKVLGCLVCEAIQTAFAVVSEETDSFQNKKEVKEMLYGNIKFRREIHRKSKKNNSLSDSGVVVCGKESIDAVCGIRGIWVMHSARRSGIATSLLNVMRENFTMGSIVKTSQCAFSQPTCDAMREVLKSFIP